MLRNLGRLLGLSVALLISSSCSESGKDDPMCATGSEGCRCRSGSCDSGLECRSNLCVEGAAQGGSAGIAGTKATGGSTSGSGTGGNAPMAGSSAAGTPAGGSSGGSQAGNGGDSGGNAGASGAACGDTMNDWQNCGACGRKCDNGGENCGTGSAPACCANGVCAPALASCFAESSGFSTCAKACESAGETCVAKGCLVEATMATWLGWGLGSGCETLGIANTGSTGACDAPLTWTGEDYRRCCCTDTK
jgi:hypothetical protein